MSLHRYYQTFSALIIILSIINVNLIQSAATPSPCLNYCSGGGYCYKSDAGPKCICSPKWTGERCNIPQNGAFVDQMNDTQVGMTLRSYLCKQLPADFCKNRGICYLNEEKLLACQCPYPFAGDYCEEVEISECEGYCLNGGTCEIDDEDNPKCTCPPGLTGVRCSKQLTTTTTTAITTTTTSLICAALGTYCNSGTCVIFNDKPTCQCPLTHTGTRCEKPVGGASSVQPTQPGQTPIVPTQPGQTPIVPTQPGQTPVVPGTLTTARPPGVTCAQQPCRNGGRCYPDGNSYICRCVGGFSGTNCDAQG